MKKALFILLSIAVAAGLYAAISGTAHDFTSFGWSGGEICLPCHTPHNGSTTVTGAPLWNHDVTTSTFTVYSSGTLDATVGAPAGNSLLCLSCHDGVVAVDSFGGTTGTVTIDTINTGSGDFGTDLSNDHPISFVYNTALATADGELFDPSTTPAAAAL